MDPELRDAAAGMQHYSCCGRIFPQPFGGAGVHSINHKGRFNITKPALTVENKHIMKMKTYLLLPALVCAAVVSVSPALMAADETVPGPSPSQPATPPQEGQHRGGGNLLEMLTKKLDLTADQQAKLKPILDDQHEKMKALHEDASLKPEDKKEKAKSLREAANDQIKAILTPDQQTKYAALLAEMKEHREKQHEQAPAAAPSATP